jgi:uncharacterized membrane-anchored protein
VSLRLRPVATSFVLTILVGLATDAVAQQSDLSAQFAALDWQLGPTNGDLGGIAVVNVPEGHRFLQRGDAGKFLELLENPTDGSELGILVPNEGSWFVVFEFSADGYVKDDDRKLDADAILSSIREGTEASNEIRRQRGWSTMEIVGWQQRPFYDPRTNNLTWSIRGSSDGSETINHSTRLLGRRGVMSANLVLAPEDISAALPQFNTVLTGFSFKPGQRYAEFQPGDRVAEYGLAGLIVGGTGVALVKTGLLQKFWKLIVFGFIALAGAVKRFIKSFGQKREAPEQPANV